MVGRRPYLQAGLLLANLSIVAGPCGPGLAAERSAIVTLEAAAREAVAWHPSITQAVGALGARDAEVDAARAGYRPTISAGLASGYDNRISGTWRPRPQVAASQMLYDFGKVASDVAAARAGTQIGRAGVLLAVDTLIRDTGYALIEVQRAAALRRVAEDQAASVAQIGDLVGRRATMGAATRSDALQAQARVEAATARLSQIAAEERRWTSNLGYLLGRDAPPAGVSPSVPAWLLHSCSGPLPDTQSVPAVMAADAEAVRAAAYVRRSRADRYPTLSIGGDASTDIASPFGSRGIYNVGLRVSSNVFAGGLAKARVRGAGFELDAAEANARRVRNETGQRLAEAQAQIDSLSQLVVTLGARETNMRETGRLYRIQYLEMGTRTLVDLLNAEQELQQVRFEAVNTAHDLRRLEIDCLFLTGRMRDAFGLAGTSVRGVAL